MRPNGTSTSGQGAVGLAVSLLQVQSGGRTNTDNTAATHCGLTKTTAGQIFSPSNDDHSGRNGIGTVSRTTDAAAGSCCHWWAPTTSCGLRYIRPGRSSRDGGDDGCSKGGSADGRGCTSTQCGFATAAAGRTVNPSVGDHSGRGSIATVSKEDRRGSKFLLTLAGSHYHMRAPTYLVRSQQTAWGRWPQACRRMFLPTVTLAYRLPRSQLLGLHRLWLWCYHSESLVVVSPQPQPANR